MSHTAIRNRAPEVPKLGPPLLEPIVAHLERSLEGEKYIDACRYLRDSLVLLTDYFAGVAVGALGTVGPYSSTLTYLMDGDPSILQSEQLLKQALTDWKAHPHHPAYEGLRDVFFISSRLQSSRLAPRRHTRWLGIEGRPVSNLEELAKWSRRLRLKVAGDDIEFCKQQIPLYLPLLHVWLKACKTFCSEWSQTVEVGTGDEGVKFKIVLKKDDVRFELTPRLESGLLESPVSLGADGKAQVGELGPLTTITSGNGSVAPAPSPAPSEPVADPVVPVADPVVPVAEEAAPPVLEEVAPVPDPSPQDISAPIADVQEMLSGSGEGPEVVSADTAPDEDAELQLVWDEASGSYRVVASTDAPTEEKTPQPSSPEPAGLPDLNALVQELESDSAPSPGPVLPTGEPLTPTEEAVAASPLAPVEEPESAPEPLAPAPEPVTEIPALIEEPAPLAPAEPEPEPLAPAEEPVAESPLAPTPEPEPLAPAPEPVAEIPALIEEPAPLAPAEPEPEPLAPAEEPLAPAEEPMAESPLAPTPEPEPLAPAPEPVAEIPALIEEPAPLAPAEAPLAPAEEPMAEGPLAPTPEPEPLAPAPEPVAEIPALIEEPAPLAPAEPEPLAPAEEPVAESPLAPTPEPEPLAPEPLAPAEPEPLAPAEEPVAESPLAPTPESEPLAPEPEPLAPAEEPIAESPLAPAEAPTPEPEPLAPEPEPLAPAEEPVAEIPALIEEPAPLTPEPEPLAPEPLAPEPEPLAPAEEPVAESPLAPAEASTPEPEPLAPAESEPLAPAEEPVAESPIPEPSPEPEPLAPQPEPLAPAEPEPLAPAVETVAASPPVEETTPEPLAPEPAMPEPLAPAEQSPLAPVEEVPTPEPVALIEEPEESATQSPLQSGIEPLAPSPSSAEPQPPIPEFSASSEVAPFQGQPEAFSDDAAVSPEFVPEVPATVEPVADSQESVPSLPEIPDLSEGIVPAVGMVPGLPSFLDAGDSPVPDLPSFMDVSDAETFTPPDLPTFELTPEAEATGFTGLAPEFLTDPGPTEVPEIPQFLTEETPVAPPTAPEPPAVVSQPLPTAESPAAPEPMAPPAPAPEPPQPEPVAPLPEIAAAPIEPVAPIAHVEPAPITQVGPQGEKKESTTEFDDGGDQLEEVSTPNDVDGLPQPNWKAWTPADRDRVERELASLLGKPQARFRPDYLLATVKRLVEDAPSGYLLVRGHEGAGKTFLARSLMRNAEALGKRGLRVLGRIEKEAFEDPHGSLFLEQLNRSASSTLVPRNHRVAALDPKTLKDLTVQYGEQNRGDRFNRYLSELCQLNRSSILVVLDGLSEACLSYVERPLPEGLYVIILCDPSKHSADYMVKLRAVPGAAETEISTASPNYNQLLNQYVESLPALAGLTETDREKIFIATDRRLHYVRAAAEGIGASIFSSADAVPQLGQFYAGLLSGLSEVTDEGTVTEEFVPFFASLALSHGSVTLDDIDQWPVSPDTVLLALALFPASLYYDDTGLCPAVGLGHESLGEHLRQTYPEIYKEQARKLVSWVSKVLLASNEAHYKSGQMRQWARFNFLRIYDWALVSDSEKLLSAVVNSKELHRKRIALFGAIDAANLFHQKVEILDLLIAALQQMVEKYGDQSLRDEWAWALSSRALTYLRLADLKRGLVDIEKAVELFTVLVDGEGQTEFTNGLAAAHNRRSEIHKQLGQHESALVDAEKAVEIYSRLVEHDQRLDLRYLLVIAYHNRASIRRSLKKYEEAKTDCQQAIRLARLLVQEGDERQKPQLAAAYHTAALVDLALERLEATVEDASQAVRLYGELVDEGRNDLRNELAGSHNNRGSAYHRMGDFAKAEADYSKAITIRTQLFDEGRFDLRDDLALTYGNRGSVSAALGKTGEVLRDYGKAIELRKTLVEREGRLDEIPDLAQNLLYRGSLYRASGQFPEAVSDFEQAAIYYLKLAQNDPAMRREAASSLNQQALCYLAADDFGSTLKTCAQVLEMLSADPSPAEIQETAVSRNNRGEAFRKVGRLTDADKEYGKAIEIYTALLERQGRVEVLGDLANALINRARVAISRENAQRAVEDSSKAVEAYSALIKQQNRTDLIPRLAGGYAVRGAAFLTAKKVNEAVAELNNSIELFKYCQENGFRETEQSHGEAYRNRAKAYQLSEHYEASLKDAEEANKYFLVTRQTNQKGPWLDELARSWIIQGGSFYKLKDFARAETSLNDAVEHFVKQLQSGRPHYFRDLKQALTQRAENARTSGKIDKVLEEYGNLIKLAHSTMQQHPEFDFLPAIAEALLSRGKAYQEQGGFQEAYQDYQQAIETYGVLVSQRDRYDLAGELAQVYLVRARMLDRAGHPEPALKDFSESVGLCQALVSQGQSHLAPFLCEGLRERASAFKALNRLQEAQQDISVAIAMQMQLAQTQPTTEVFADLGGSLLLQGSLLQQLGQPQQAAGSYDRANQIYTGLVEGQGKTEYSGEWAQCLMARTNLAGGAIAQDPQMLNILNKAVQLVTRQARDGAPVPKDFPTECLQTVVEAVNRSGSQSIPDLLDSTLAMLDVAVNSKSQLDFVKLTDLLLAASAGLADDRRSPRRGHFLALACISCNREIQIFGQNSLPRLVYCLYELGQVLERSKPPEALGFVGSSFQLLLELLRNYRGNEDFYRELKMMVSTWRSLPPQTPALANVSRQTLSHLLRVR